jgi:adenylosuccinate synthase
MNGMARSLDVIVGGQFGSEAKGHVTKRVIDRIQHHDDLPVVNVRVAGPNAGHCVRDERGNKFALQSIPVGAVYPNINLHVAPGSEVDFNVLEREINTLLDAGHVVAGRMTVSPEATILTDRHVSQEVGMHEKMGSTGKGIGACRADRIMRKANRVGDSPGWVAWLESHGIHVGEFDYHDHHVIIEGTQGYGLGLHAGHYPQCTSSDTRAIDFCAMAGINPWDTWQYNFNIWVVARVYPIRVAGNSGPLKGETTWESLNLPVEHTTVTKKVRRVGEWDAELVNAALDANGRSRTRLAITMVDQKFGFMQGISADTEADLHLTHDQWGQLRDYLAGIRVDLQHEIDLITTGEDTGVWIR